MLYAFDSSRNCVVFAYPNICKRTIKAKEGVENPKSLDDYDITLETLDGLTPEVIDLV